MKVLTDLTPTPENQELIYNALDTMQTMALKETFDQGLIPDWAKSTYRYSEKMLGPMLTMMRRGVQIDVAKRDRFVAQLRDRISGVTRTFDTLCEELFGTTINWNSTPQLKILFYEFLAIPEQTKSKKGEVKVATDREVLERIDRDYPRGRPFCKLILRIKDLESQIEFLTKKLSPTNRFHTSYNVSGTETFRLSSSEHPLRIGCVPDDAEALTPAGWVPIKTRPQQIMQWAPDGQLNFVTVAQWSFAPVDVWLDSYSGRCVRGLFTPEHRVPYFTSKGKLRVKAATDVRKLSCVSTPVAGVYKPGISVDPSWVRKLVMMSADGNEYAPGKWRIKFKKARKNLRCAWVLGVPPQKLCAYGYYDYNNVAVAGLTKKFPDLTKWDYESRRVFFDELRHWDAHIRGNSYIYYTTIPENADIVMTAAHMTGLSASLFVNQDNSNKYGNTSTRPLYSVNISKKTTNKLESKRWQTEKFTGYVGCPTVESGYWLIRYRGGIYVTGNSNQQNIPSAARQCFVADPGYLFFQADQQGAEARVVAYESGDPNYIEACIGGDSHTMVAAMVFGFEPLRELAERNYYRTYSYRDIAKRGAHGSNYYGKPFTLAKQMQVDVDVAEQFQFKYFKRFPGITDWHNDKAKRLQEDGYLCNPFEFRRTFWSRRWDDATLREAIAFGPQSTVGILTNIGLYNLWCKYEGQPGAPVQILMNGHDAVIGQLREDMADQLIPEILACLRFPFTIQDVHGVRREVVIPFDMEVGRNWGKRSDTNPDGLTKWKPKT